MSLQWALDQLAREIACGTAQRPAGSHAPGGHNLDPRLQQALRDLAQEFKEGRHVSHGRHLNGTRGR